MCSSIQEVTPAEKHKHVANKHVTNHHIWLRRHSRVESVQRERKWMRKMEERPQKNTWHSRPDSGESDTWHLRIGTTWNDIRNWEIVKWYRRREIVEISTILSCISDTGVFWCRALELSRIFYWVMQKWWGLGYIWEELFWAVGTDNPTGRVTLMMTSAKVVKTAVTTDDNNLSQDYTNPDDQTTRSNGTPLKPN